MYITNKRILIFESVSRQKAISISLQNLVAANIEPSGFDHTYGVETICIDTGRTRKTEDGIEKDCDYFSSVGNAAAALQLLKSFIEIKNVDEGIVT